jgi:protein TonB
MFDELVESSAVRTKTNKTWTVVLSAILQVVVVGVFVLITLIYTEALPKQFLNTFLVAPPPPAPPPPPAAAVTRIVKPVVHLIQSGKLMAPTAIPKKVEIIKEEEAPDVGATGVTGGVVGGIPGGAEGGVLGGIFGSTGGAPPPPPPKAAAQRIRVGGNVQEAKIISKPLPVYPEIAKTAHIQGTVLLHAIIGKDGRVAQLQFISGPPLLMRSAMDAVREWRYQPTLLNGDPVEVDTTISVVFTFGG